VAFAPDRIGKLGRDWAVDKGGDRTPEGMGGAAKFCGRHESGQAQGVILGLIDASSSSQSRKKSIRGLRLSYSTNFYLRWRVF
jgi:hypothetical protein